LQALEKRRVRVLLDLQIVQGDAHEVGAPTTGVPMAALIQGFPRDWRFWGKKTPAYRQVGNAFPPPVAEAVGNSIRRAIQKAAKATLRATA
jgi:DNA (cytosine-5)-methyltransferase 1